MLSLLRIPTNTDDGLLGLKNDSTSKVTLSESKTEIMSSSRHRDQFKGVVIELQQLDAKPEENKHSSSSSSSELISDKEEDEDNISRDLGSSVSVSEVKSTKRSNEPLKTDPLLEESQNNSRMVTRAITFKRAPPM